MSTAGWSPVSVTVVSAGAGAGRPRPTRLLADRVVEVVCRSLAAGGARAEVEVVELHRLAADLAQHAAHGRVSLDLREAVAAVAAADGLVVATPVLAASPGELFDSFFTVLGDRVLAGMPVLLALRTGSHRPAPGLAHVLRGRLAGVRADPVSTVVVAGPPDLRGTPDGDAGELDARIGRAAAELAAAMRPHRH
ncbi:NAD(P)H-dependent oxidoreductase [Streptomyces fumanus]|uniref:NAD(P)H-dependent oxidoreductase n=1 Tax=Streptomyces fumanus TaxID=67302 RepID=UPI003409D773